MEKTEMDSGLVIFIESNTSGTGGLFCEAVRYLKLKPLILCADAERYQFVKDTRIENIIVDTADLDAVRNAVKSLLQRENIRGIYSTSDYFIETAALLARENGCPGPDPTAVRKCRNKLLQRDCLRLAGFAGPRYGVIFSVSEARELAKTIKFPIVVKPIASTGSIGVKLCKDLSGLCGHVEILLNRGTKNERGLSEPAGVLMESYLAGPEFSAEVFNGKVIGITKKYLSAEPYFVELGHDFPAIISPAAAAAVADVIERAVTVLGLSWGPIHAEFRLCGDEINIIEVNPRLAGGYIPELVRLAHGVDLIAGTVKLVINEKPEIVPHKKYFASIRYITTPAEGTFLSFENRKEAKAAGADDLIVCYRQVGDTIRRFHDFRDRLGHVLSLRETPEEAAAAAENARRQIEVKVEGRYSYA